MYEISAPVVPAAVNEKFAAIIAKTCEQLDLTLAESQVKQLIDYVLLLEKWNQTYNLTAIRDAEAMLYRHVIDALSVVKVFDNQSVLADIGTGAGIPGLIIAIVYPDSRVYLLDSVGKKCRFLQQAVQMLQLNKDGERVFVVNERVEKWQPQQQQPDLVFDFIICRAFTSLKNFTTITRHLGADKTYWLAMKAEDITAEKADMDAAYTVVKDEVLKVPFESACRRLLWIKKTQDKGYCENNCSM